jgi:UDP-MurNAc hydroxylase
MRVTYLGHAGMLIETGQASILCDPWFSPAYFASWFPFPDNGGIDLGAIARPDFLYVSHQHHDHFDPGFLESRVSKDATVLLPDFPVDDLGRELRKLGFRRFERLPDREPVDLGGGLRVMGVTEVTTSDGPLGDSALAVDDGTARLLDQNDARPRDLEALAAFGSFDAHFLQFSGAIWYPVVYALDPEVKAGLSREKRLRGMDRALRYVEDVSASHVFPSAGPPCFLDRSLFGFNDLGEDDSNPFPDQTVFLEHLRSHGVGGGRLVVPGSVVDLEGGRCALAHPGPEAEVMAPFQDKRAYLEAYRERQARVLEEAHRSWPGAGSDHPAAEAGMDVVGMLREWWEPLLAKADRLCAGIGAPVLLRAGDVAVVVDFPARQVRPFGGEECPYRFHFQAGPFLASVAAREQDWVNGLFLSMRFTAERDGPYNEHLYAWFKCMSEERLAYAEKVAPAPAGASGPSRIVPGGRRGARRRQAGRPEEEWCELGGWRVQRHCPHLQADLCRFGTVDDGVLTCQLHGWQFDLATGKCLTSEDWDPIRAEPLDRARAAEG